MKPALRGWRDGWPVALVVAALAASSWLVMPGRAWTPPVQRSEAPLPRVTAPPALPTDLESYAVIWQRNLQQALVDPPTPPPAPAEAPPPFQLIGTAVEPGRAFAVFQSHDGSIIVRECGAPVGEFLLSIVDRGRVQLRREGRDIELRVPWYPRLVAEGQP